MKKKISAAITLLVILSSIFSINVFALETATIKEGTYTIQSKLGSNMVLDVDDASKKSGANIQLYKSNGSTAQQFEIKKSGSYYTITPKCSGLKVDVKGGSTEAGANVWQYTSNNSNSQKWQFYNAGNGYYYIRCKIGDKALDVSGGKSSNGTNIQMYTLNQSDAQKWKLIPVKNTKDLADVARAEIGYQGRNKNGKGTGDYTKYGKFTGINGQQWCASFVSWCANKAGISTKVIYKTADCDTMERKSNSYHKWGKNSLELLKKNDVIFFAKTSNMSDSDHVGIVTSVNTSKKTITIIEGNTGSYYGPDIVKEITYTVNSANGKITKGYKSGYSFCGYISVD